MSGYLPCRKGAPHARVQVPCVCTHGERGTCKTDAIHGIAAVRKRYVWDCRQVHA